MRRVLVIVSAFPPIGGVGVLRTTKFAKYLPMFGWNPIVLTPKRTIDRQMDSSLLKDIKGIRVIRTPSFEPVYRGGAKPISIITMVLRRLFDALLPPDAGVLWVGVAMLWGIGLLRREKVDVIFATGGFFSSFLFGYLLAKVSGIPLVLDYRDEWTTQAGRNVSSAYHRTRFRIERLQERCIARYARAIIVVTEEMKDELAFRLGIPPEKISVVLNGHDVTEACPWRRRKWEDKIVCVRYLGSLYNDGSPGPLLKELDNWARDLNKRITVEFIGGDNVRIRQEVQIQSYTHITPVFHAPVDYVTAAELLREADCNLAIVYQERLRHYPQKVFDYIGARRPFLLLSREPLGINEIVKRSGVGWVLTYDRPQEWKTTINEAMKAVLTQSGQRLFQERIDENVIGQLHRRELTRQLAVILARSCG